jgi:hypothetical protein
MATMPQPQHSTARAIYRLHEDKRGSARPYLGASEAGHSCARRLWLSFRHAARESFDGRMLRLFETGNVEELRVLAELEGIGIRLEGLQEEVSRFGGHFMGHCDGIGLGFPEAAKTWHLIEVKTHNAKSFAALLKDGVRKSKPMHWAQVQIYMGELGLERCMYIAVNKDTDEIHVERIEFDKAEHARLINRVTEVIFANEPPLKISEDAGWYECRVCPFHTLCHGEAIPEPNCRTCAHSTPTPEGGWHCAHWSDRIPADGVESGCDEHRFIPAVVERVLELVSVEDGNVVTWCNKTNGAAITQPLYSSRELHDATDKKFLGDEWVQMMKAQFPGSRVVASGNRTDPLNDGFQDDLPWRSVETPA